MSRFGWAAVVGMTALTMSAASCSGLWGTCGDSDPEPLVSGTYDFDYSYTSTTETPLGDIGDGTLLIDRAGETATLTYTRDGTTVTQTFAITDVRDGSY